jgi:hypothetical protein
MTYRVEFAARAVRDLVGFASVLADCSLLSAAFIEASKNQLPIFKSKGRPPAESHFVDGSD